tara:strand:+ start:38 stop:2227 length:2190 start_codon:yes stop_codon:yes gene_type:complete
MAGYSARQSSFSSGDTITAAHTNDEFNTIVAAFNVSTGHTHDGSTAGDGGPISKLFSNAITFGTNANTDIAVTFDGSSNDGVLTWMEDEDYFQFSDDILLTTTEKLQFRDTAIYINSSADGQLDLVADTEIQIAATTVDINGAVDISGNLGVGGNLTVTGTTTFNGGTLTLGDADTDNIVFGGEVDSDIIPDDDGTFDLGSASKEWQDLFIDGTANIDSLVADTADINGGTIDGAVIGGASAAAITGTAITGTSFVIGSADIGETELEILDGATVTTTELNLIDGGTARGTTAVASGDGILINDGGTMRMTNVDTVSTYFASHTVGGGNIVTTGALNSGSITSGFGAIDNGSSAITTTGTVTYGSLSDGTITATAFVDEDDMSSDSATLIPTQQSVKAYVDSQSADMSFVLEDGDGTEVTITRNKEVKFVEGGGVDINWTDTDNGTDGDPYDLTFGIVAAQTGITSVVNSSLVLGRDADNDIDFTTDNQITFRVGANDGVVFKTSGEIEAASLDISGDADIDGTLEADAITVGGTALATVIAGTTVTNATNSAHVSVADNESTNEENLIPFIEDTSATGNVGLESDGDFAYNPSTGTVSATIFKGNIDAVDGDFDGTLEADAITIGGTAIGSIYSAIAGSSSIVTTGALNAGSITSGFGTINNGASAITTTGTVNFGSLADGTITVTAFVDEDDMSTNSATLVPTQQSVKAYADTKASPGFAVAMAIAL